ncbi:hypothetical protein C8R46DRAFT_1201670 [Mycena filopes]|nr:hypothetical protein C8R46DRAFT_1201670 [Mycena filopes]
MGLGLQISCAPPPPLPRRDAPGHTVTGDSGFASCHHLALSNPSNPSTYRFVGRSNDYIPFSIDRICGPTKKGAQAILRVLDSIENHVRPLRCRNLAPGQSGHTNAAEYCTRSPPALPTGFPVADSFYVLLPCVQLWRKDGDAVCASLCPYRTSRSFYKVLRRTAVSSTAHPGLQHGLLNKPEHHHRPDSKPAVHALVPRCTNRQRHEQQARQLLAHLHTADTAHPASPPKAVFNPSRRRQASPLAATISSAHDLPADAFAPPLRVTFRRRHQVVETVSITVVMLARYVMAASQCQTFHLIGPMRASEEFELKDEREEDHGGVGAARAPTLHAASSGGRRGGCNGPEASIDG